MNPQEQIKELIEYYNSFNTPIPPILKKYIERYGSKELLK